MAECDMYLEMISELVDGELGGEDEAALRAHMEGCADCKRVYEAYRSIGEAMRGEPVEPPETLARGVMYKIRRIESGYSTKRFAFGKFTAFAACLALVLFAAGRFGLFGGDAPAPEGAPPVPAPGEAYSFSTEEDYANDIIDENLVTRLEQGVADKSEPEATMHMLGESIEETAVPDAQVFTLSTRDGATLNHILSLPLEELERPISDVVAEVTVYEGGDLEAEPYATLTKPDEIKRLSELLALRLELELIDVPEDEPMLTLAYKHKDKEMLAKAYRVGDYIYCLIITREQAELEAEERADAAANTAASAPVRSTGLSNALRKARNVSPAPPEDDETRFEHICYLANCEPDTLIEFFAQLID